jgi:adenylate cyclase
LALAAVAAFDGVAATVVERADGVQVGARFVPLPDDGLFRVNWADGLERAEIVPAIEILRGVETARLADKIVIVGVTEPTFGDLHLVPTDRSGSTPGVVVHANAVNTVLTASFLTPVGALREVVLLLAVVAIVAAAFIWLRLSIAALAGFAAIALVIGFGTWRFHTAGELWPLVWPAVGATMAALAGWAWRYVVEIRHRRRAWKLFATYVPATVVDQLAEQGRLEEAIDGARLDIAVVFCDLRGFTPIAATLEPAEVRRLLDRYYDYAVALIHASGGTVMQFVGDEVFAVFGAPIPSSTFVVDALRCAQALQANVGRLDAALAEAGLPPIRFGIGVHRGPVVAAHVGTTDRRQYAVIGDTVNVGSRLCGQAGPSEIVTSTTTVDTLDVDLLVELGLELEEPVELKGVNEPVGVLRRRSTPRSSPV